LKIAVAKEQKRGGASRPNCRILVIAISMSQSHERK